MSGIKLSPEDFERLMQKNRNLRVSARSASRPKSENKGPAKPAAIQTDKDKLSAHGKALKQLRERPELIKGNEEHYIQVELFWWLENNYPELYERTHAVPNSGKRGPLTAWKMQAEGQKKGVLDTCMDLARGKYHGFRCELKTEKGKPSDEQEKKAIQLRADGYCAVFAYGLDAVKRAFLDYANLTGDEELPHEYR